MFWNRNNDAWLSLVERCVRDAEAAGSNPVASTLGRGARRPVDACSAPTGTECRAGNRLDKGFPVLFIFCIQQTCPVILVISTKSSTKPVRTDYDRILRSVLSHPASHSTVLY